MPDTGETEMEASARRLRTVLERAMKQYSRRAQSFWHPWHQPFDPSLDTVKDEWYSRGKRLDIDVYLGLGKE